MYSIRPKKVFKIIEAAHLLVMLDDWYNDCQKGNWIVVFLEVK